MIGNIDDVVEEYITANLKEVGDVDVVEGAALKRISPQTKEFEILAIERAMPYKIDSSDDIVLKAKVRRNFESLKKFQFTTLIDNVGNGGERTGMAFTDEIFWPEGKQEADFEIRVPGCQLAQGKYIIDLWTCTGDILSSYKYYDCVNDTVTFRVETWGGMQIAEWHNYWGENSWRANAQLF